MPRIIYIFLFQPLVFNVSDLLSSLSFDALVFFLLLLRSNVILPNAEGVSLAIKVILIKPVLVLTCSVADCLGTCFVSGGFKCIPLLVNVCFSRRMINKTRGERFLEFGSYTGILDGFDAVFLFVLFYVNDSWKQGKCS